VLTILAIDDHEATRKIIEHICTASGFNCITTATAQEGISLAQHLKPTAIFVDLQLPGELNGWEVIQAFKNDLELQESRVIAITAGDYRKTALKAGSDGYVQKPFTAKQILNAIQQAK
jgi:CheY-like chemotaxis protein